MGILQPNARHGSSNDQSQLEAAIVVHGLAQVEIALAAATAVKRRVLLFSSQEAASVLGYEVFIKIVEQAAQNYPNAEFSIVFDCGDKIGIALAAIRAGAKYILFKGNKKISAKISNIAKIYGVNLLDWPESYLDLCNESNPKDAVHSYLK